jgi:hypothetical protein
MPDWIGRFPHDNGELFRKPNPKKAYIGNLLRQIYIALNNDCPALAVIRVSRRCTKRGRLPPSASQRRTLVSHRPPCPAVAPRAKADAPHQIREHPCASVANAGQ